LLGTYFFSSGSAIHTRDASGLMPTHWLWVRFVSSLVALERGGRGSDDTVTLDVPQQSAATTSSYTEFAVFERGDLETDLLVIRRLDPSVDFLRMRHIPLEVLGEGDSLRWAERTAEILAHVRSRHAQIVASEGTGGSQVVWTRREAVASLFWTKLVSLLEASRHVGDWQPQGKNSLVHTAFANDCFLPAVTRIVATLFPQEMHMQDERGRLPLHYAAARKWHSLDWPPEGLAESAAARPSRLFRMETLNILKMAMELSGDDAASVVDSDGRLPLHYMVETFVDSSNRRAWNQPVLAMLDLMAAMVQLFPDALRQQDGVTGLFPCFQATATATSCTQGSDSFTPEIHLTIPFMLLREDPTLILRAVRPV
jgi:hypothetical protein